MVNNISPEIQQHYSDYFTDLTKHQRQKLAANSILWLLYWPNQTPETEQHSLLYWPNQTPETEQHSLTTLLT